MKNINKKVFLFFLSFVLFSTLKADSIENLGTTLVIAQTLITPGYSVATRDLNGSVEFLESQIFNYITTQSIKHNFPKQRPDHSDNLSIVSKHTSVAFTNAAYASLRYGLNRYTLSSYAVAAFVGYSRVESKQHYVEDVLSGAVIGTLSAYLFTSKAPTSNFTIEYLHDHFSITFDYTF